MAATQVLRPQDCLTSSSPAAPPPGSRRRRNFTAGNRSFPNPNLNFNNPSPSSSSSANPGSNRNLKKKQSSPPPPNSKQSASVDDMKVTGNHHPNRHRQSSSHGNLVMEKVTILRRGESLDSKIKSMEEAAAKSVAVAADDCVVVDLSSPARRTDVYAGFAFDVSPSPESLPLPSFYQKRKQLAVDDCASRDLRRLLRLEF